MPDRHVGTVSKGNWNFSGDMCVIDDQTPKHGVGCKVAEEENMQSDSRTSFF
jgi:hypothetical protein